MRPPRCQQFNEAQLPSDFPKISFDRVNSIVGVVFSSLMRCPNIREEISIFSTYVGRGGALHVDFRWKERFRRYDHAAIFLMIASTHTPFALVAIDGRMGQGLLTLVWLLATAGMVLKIGWPGRLERASVIMYLALGWAGLPAVGLLLAARPPSTLALLGAGGLLYTVGVVFHLRENLPYQNAIWHGFVSVAAVCHFASVFQTLSG